MAVIFEIDYNNPNELQIAPNIPVTIIHTINVRVMYAILVPIVFLNRIPQILYDFVLCIQMPNPLFFTFSHFLWLKEVFDSPFSFSCI